MGNVVFKAEDTEGTEEDEWENDIPPKKKYPIIGKKDINHMETLLLERPDALSLSCYARPTHKSVIYDYEPVKNVA